MKRLALLITLAALTAGCAPMKYREETMRERALEAAEKARTGPRSGPVKNITNFSSALRCMDERMMMYGIRDLVVITPPTHARAPRPMGTNALDPEMGALVHKEKARQQTMAPQQPQQTAPRQPRRRLRQYFHQQQRERALEAAEKARTGPRSGHGTHGDIIQTGSGTKIIKAP
jgi:hypothetical protein